MNSWIGRPPQGQVACATTLRLLHLARQRASGQHPLYCHFLLSLTTQLRRHANAPDDAVLKLQLLRPDTLCKQQQLAESVQGSQSHQLKGCRACQGIIP